MCEGRRQLEIDRWIRVVSAVMRTLYWSFVVKRAEPKGKAFCLPVDLHSAPHLWSKLRVMTERMRSWIQAAEMSFLRRVAGDGMRNSIIRGRLGEEPLLWLGCPLEASLGRCLVHVQLGRGPGADPGHAGEIISPDCLGNASASPSRNKRRWLGRGRPGLLCLGCCPFNPNMDKWINGWMHAWKQE